MDDDELLASITPKSAAEWEACVAPKLLIRAMGLLASLRKLRLLHVALARRATDFIPYLHQYLPRTIETAERYADGLASDDELSQMYDTAVFAPIAHQRPSASNVFERIAESSLARATGGVAAAAVAAGSYPLWNLSYLLEEITKSAGLEEPSRQCSLIRDFFDNPFHSVSPNPHWRTSTAINLAKKMYDARDFSFLPLLADALDDAGCDIERVIEHCRKTETHVRGCWVVDLLLDKN